MSLGAIRMTLWSSVSEARGTKGITATVFERRDCAELIVLQVGWAIATVIFLIVAAFPKAKVGFIWPSGKLGLFCKNRAICRGFSTVAEMAASQKGKGRTEKA